MLSVVKRRARRIAGARGMDKGNGCRGYMANRAWEADRETGKL